MKKVKVIIKNKTTLELEEDANKGDIIDLESLSKIDLTAFENIMKTNENEIFYKRIQEAKNDAKKEMQAKLESEKSHLEKNLNIQFNEQLSLKKVEISKLEKEINNLKIEKITLENNLDKKYREELSQQNDNYRKEIENKNNEIHRLREEIENEKKYKSSLNVKMIGESLEKYCEEEFNKVRAYSFPDAYFEKDNDDKLGSKGDFIFRDYYKEGNNKNEILSIMFEMKNENDETKTKQKNEDFYKKLDTDRKNKKCEYAILVSTLEKDSDLFNSGIVDVSHKYEKMYVIRPNFFIPIISILKKAAERNINNFKQLMVYKNENVDIDNFTTKLSEFKANSQSSLEKAEKNYDAAIKEITNSIERLTKTKEALEKFKKHLNTFNDKVQGMTLRKLTKDSPSLAARFKEIKQIKELEEK